MTARKYFSNAFLKWSKKTTTSCDDISEILVREAERQTRGLNVSILKPETL